MSRNTNASNQFIFPNNVSRSGVNAFIELAAFLNNNTNARTRYTLNVRGNKVSLVKK